MSDKGRIFYLPIRAFGDFIIAATVVKGRFRDKIPILLPAYFEDLFRAIGAGEYFEIAGRLPFNNQPMFFQLFTLIRRKNWRLLKNDIAAMAGAVNRRDTYLLDYSSRRLGFTGALFFWPDKKKNNYEGKQQLFSRFFALQPGYTPGIIARPLLGNNSRLLILPDSRLSVKRIGDGLIRNISERFAPALIDVAVFSREPVLGKQRVYNDFSQLIDLILEYDMVIGAESLPYHLANYLGKPHFVIYQQSRHRKETFMTPFMIANHAYVMAEPGRPETVLKHIGQFFC